MTSDQGTYFANHLYIQVKLNYIIHDDVKLVVIVSVTAEISGVVVAICSLPRCCLRVIPYRISTGDVKRIRQKIPGYFGLFLYTVYRTATPLAVNVESPHAPILGHVYYRAVYRIRRPISLRPLMYPPAPLSLRRF